MTASDPARAVFYNLPAKYLREGVSTDDGQDVLRVSFVGSSVNATVYTPRPDDPVADADNQCMPETRIYDADEMVELAVFDDTELDLSESKGAVKRT